MPTTKAIGNRGEEIASVYLSRNGFRIVDRNWKTRWCEIDIVAKKDHTIFFVEVKYRKNSNFGDAVEYVTPKKVHQMTFAAELWASQHRYEGDMLLAVVAIHEENDDIVFMTLD